MNRINTRPFDMQNYLNSEQDIEVYLQAVLEDGDPALLAAAAMSAPDYPDDQRTTWRIF